MAGYIPKLIDVGSHKIILYINWYSVTSRDVKVLRTLGHALIVNISTNFRPLPPHQLFICSSYTQLMIGTRGGTSRHEII
jgi:hypothetical protein